jgi:hypothetical protein
MERINPSALRAYPGQARGRLSPDGRSVLNAEASVRSFTALMLH